MPAEVNAVPSEARDAGKYGFCASEGSAGSKLAGAFGSTSIDEIAVDHEHECVSWTGGSKVDEGKEKSRRQ